MVIGEEPHGRLCEDEEDGRDDRRRGSTGEYRRVLNTEVQSLSYSETLKRNAHS